MDWCSYFRCQDGLQFAAIDQAIADEAPNYQRFAPPPVATAAGTQIRMTIYHREIESDAPQWVGFLAQLAGQATGSGSPIPSHSAIALVEKAGIHYVLTYGSGHTVARRLPVEPRFGKVVLSNGKEGDEVRGITARIHGAAAKIRIERRGRGGPMRELEVPRRANMAASISAKIRLGELNHVASGGTSFRTAGASSLGDLIAILDQLETWWNAGNERDAVLAGLDRVINVTDQDEIAALDLQRKTALEQANRAGFTLNLEDEVLWDATKVEYCVARQWTELPLDQFLDTDGLLTVLKDASPRMDPLKVRYRAALPNREYPLSGRLADNLAYEMPPANPGNPSSIFEDGKWYRASASWRDQVSNDVNLLFEQSRDLLQGVSLPRYVKGTTEDAYIEDVLIHQPLADRCLKLHKEFPPTEAKLELCDICVDGRVLMVMKRGADREACDDVVQQALNSASALLDTTSWFIDWANERLSSKNWMIQKLMRRELVYCVTLLVGRANIRPDFTIRAMDALSTYLHEIEKFGFRAAVMVV